MRILASPAFSNEKVNPYNALLYKEISKQAPSVCEYTHKRALLEKFDIVHFHWPDGFINPPHIVKAWQRVLLFVLVIISVKIKGAKLVWTVHNIRPHDAFHPRLSQAFMDWFVEQCDGFIFMSAQSQATFDDFYKLPKSKPSAIIPHGHYRNSYPAAINQTAARQQLDLPPGKLVLLSFGMIKPYKNIDGLINAFKEAKLAECCLVIAGNTDSTALAEKLVSLKADDPDIALYLKFIPDDQLHLYFSAADIVVLPYKAILNSGALLLALSFDKPVIAPAIGAFKALQQELGSQWVHCYSGDFNGHILEDAINQMRHKEREAICPLTNYNWQNLADMTIKFYSQLMHTQNH